MEHRFIYLSLPKNRINVYYNSSADICPECSVQINSKEIYKLNKIRKSLIITEAFNAYTDPNIYPYLYKATKNIKNLLENLDDRLHELKRENLTPSCHTWKGSNYYYKKLFGISIYLKDTDIPREFYEFRERSYFSDMICGHPLASNGWCNEAMKNLIELGAVTGY